MSVDDRFSPERFRAFGPGHRPAVEDLLRQLEEAIEVDLQEAVSRRMAEIATRLNGLGHRLVLYDDSIGEIGYHDQTDVPDGEHCWLRINVDIVGSAGWLGLGAGLDEPAPAEDGGKPIWEIRMLIESDEPAERERITDALANILCPLPVSEHDECPTPWFIVSTPLAHLDEDEAERWRDVLNRD